MCEWRFDFVSTSDNIEIYYLVVECEIKHEERKSKGNKKFALFFLKIVNVLTLSEYSSFSVRPKARAMTRFFPKKNVECVFQLSRTCWKWVFRILSTANTNNLGYSSTDFLILSTKAWKLNKQWRVSNNACVLQFNHLLR